ncbi:MAG: hypothetical protein KBD28_03580 [Chitinophagaceae bacterium]|nr:hypothetical protein [Chitinophagaceae bacterium]
MKASQIGQLINGILTIVIGSLTLFGISQEKLTIIQGALLLTMPLVISITSTIDKVIDTKKSVIYSAIIFSVILIGGAIDYMNLFPNLSKVGEYIRICLSILILILNFVVDFLSTNKVLSETDAEDIKSTRPKSAIH